MIDTSDKKCVVLMQDRNSMILEGMFERDFTVINRNQALHLIGALEVFFHVPSTHDLYERAIHALKTDSAPRFSPNGDVANMDAGNERQFANSTPVMLVANIFNKKPAQIAADVIGQACEPQEV